MDEANKRVVTTLAHDIVYDAPQVTKGELDEQAAAQHYGLGETPAVDGYVDLDDHELRPTRPVGRLGDRDRQTARRRPARPTRASR